MRLTAHRPYGTVRTPPARRCGSPRRSGPRSLALSKTASSTRGSTNNGPRPVHWTGAVGFPSVPYPFADAECLPISPGSACPRCSSGCLAGLRHSRVTRRVCAVTRR